MLPWVVMIGAGDIGVLIEKVNSTLLINNSNTEII